VLPHFDAPDPTALAAHLAANLDRLME